MSTSILPWHSLPRWCERIWVLAKVRPVMSSEGLIIAGSVYFSLFSNAMFWRSAAPALPSQWLWAASLFLLVTAVHGVWLSVLVWERTARIVLTALLLVSALAGHYMAAYGIYIDADMIRNGLHTDWREASELAGMDSVLSLLPSLPPIVLVWRVKVQRRSWKPAVLARVALLASLVLMAAAGAAASTQRLTAFLRNQREVRYLVTPANVLVSLAKVVSEEPPGKARVQTPIGEDAVQSPAAGRRRPRLLLLVVGETARAANWGLNGYVRQTTPELALRGVINFPHVTACGSSTEVSLPCMFSVLGREHYDEKAIRGQQSLLHVLQRAGVATLWRDNQSGCKGVCSGLPQEDLRARGDAGTCTERRCFDEVLLQGLPGVVAKHRGDQVIVLHMLGNHGPNYFERYPPAFRRYTPVCETSDLGRCSREQIVNAYDNALLYTDHVLAGAIDQLKTVPGYDTAMLYVSDHGESLGEKGLYLHGMPRALAPREQLDVPMVAWFSEGWQRATRLDQGCARQHAGSGQFTHDNLVHTVLGLTDVKTALYRPDHDIFLTCRADNAGPVSGGSP